MNRKQKIYVAGHRGMVGSAIVRQLKQISTNSIIVTRNHSELDLTNQLEVEDFFNKEKLDQVYLCAAKVGGIFANNEQPADFIYTNLMIQSNVIHSAWKTGVKKLLFLGSSCIYPKISSQPMSENALLSGFLEPTNEPYAIAKIAGIKMCESYNRQYGEIDLIDYRSVMPTNLYGAGDNYHDTNSHVIPALIRRFYEAQVLNKSEVVIWGSGKVKREFLYVDDMAAASIHVMKISSKKYKENTKPMLGHINVGYGSDITIKELSQKIATTIGFKGQIKFDTEKPDGAPRKLMNSSLINNIGWKPKIDLDTGLSLAFSDFKENNQSLRLK